MASEVTKLEERQEALGTTVSDLIRIVGKLDKKFDDRFDRLENEFQIKIGLVKADISMLRDDVSFIKSSLIKVLEILNEKTE